MSTSFPGALDSFTNPGSTDTANGTGPGGAPTTHHLQHSNLNDSVAALEAKVGIDASTNSASIDYQIRYLKGLIMQLDSRMKAVGATASSSASATVDTLQVYLVSQVFGS